MQLLTSLSAKLVSNCTYYMVLSCIWRKYLSRGNSRPKLCLALFKKKMFYKKQVKYAMNIWIAQTEVPFIVFYREKALFILQLLKQPLCSLVSDTAKHCKTFSWNWHIYIYIYKSKLLSTRKLNFMYSNKWE